VVNKGGDMKFDISMEDNFASFLDKSTGMALFVDAFDNKKLFR